MAGIRVNTSVKKIEVNDNGDYITLNFSDNSLPDRFFAMLERVQKLAEDAKSREADIRAQSEGNGGNRARELAALYCGLHEGIMAETDALLGENTCQKVFGNIVPGIELFDEFFAQLIPFFEDYARERAEKLSKYSADRIGNI